MGDEKGVSWSEVFQSRLVVSCVVTATLASVIGAMFLVAGGWYLGHVDYGVVIQIGGEGRRPYSSSLSSTRSSFSSSSFSPSSSLSSFRSQIREGKKPLSSSHFSSSSHSTLKEREREGEREGEWEGEGGGEDKVVCMQWAPGKGSVEPIKGFIAYGQNYDNIDSKMKKNTSSYFSSLGSLLEKSGQFLEQWNLGGGVRLEVVGHDLQIDESKWDAISEYIFSEINNYRYYKKRYTTIEYLQPKYLGAVCFTAIKQFLFLEKERELAQREKEREEGGKVGEMRREMGEEREEGGEEVEVGGIWMGRDSLSYAYEVPEKPFLQEVWLPGEALVKVRGGGVGGVSVDLVSEWVDSYLYLTQNTNPIINPCLKNNTKTMSSFKRERREGEKEEVEMVGGGSGEECVKVLEAVMGVGGERSLASNEASEGCKQSFTCENYDPSPLQCLESFFACSSTLSEGRNIFQQTYTEACPSSSPPCSLSFSWMAENMVVGSVPQNLTFFLMGESQFMPLFFGITLDDTLDEAMKKIWDDCFLTQQQEEEKEEEKGECFLGIYTILALKNIFHFSGNEKRLFVSDIAYEEELWGVGYMQSRLYT